MRALATMCLAGCLFHQAYAQQPGLACGTAPASAELLQRIRQLALSPASRARLGTAPSRIAVKATLLVGPTRQAPSTATLDTLLARLNRQFSLLEVSFYWVGPPSVVRDQTQANTTNIAAYTATRAVYDVYNAINLYLGYVSPLGGGNSFAPLPSSPDNNNSIYIYAPTDDGTLSDYILNYVVPHEFGHYFGLSHTFFNGGSKNSSERELVTRGAGANCAQAGDFVCDTPADPYERLTIPWYIDANCQLITPGTTLVDANGERYQPDVKNMMAYFSPYACGGAMHFTPGQYERMKLGLALRLASGCADSQAYSITGTQPTTPLVALDRVVAIDNGTTNGYNVETVCLGATFRVTYSTSGLLPPGERLVAEAAPSVYQVGEALLPTFKPLITDTVAGKANQLALRFSDPSLVTGLDGGLSIRIRPALTPAISCISPTYFRVLQPGTIRLSLADTDRDTVSVVFSQSVVLRVGADQPQAIGKGRLQINEQLIDYRIPYAETIDQARQILYVPLYKTGRIRLLDGTVACGQVRLAGELTVKVGPPLLQLQQPVGLSVCAGSSLSLSFSALGGATGMPCRAQLSDANGQFASDSTGLLGSARQSPMTLRFPADLPGGTAYRLRLQVQTPQGWVAAPAGPALEVKALPTARLLGGSLSILKGDSARLALRLTGQSPWRVVLTNGPILDYPTPEAWVTVRPPQTTRYQLTSVADACGVGSVSGATTVTVLTPLANELPATGSGLRLWPNPAEGEITVEWTAPADEWVTLSLTDAAGRVNQLLPRKGTGSPLRQRISVGQLATGVYLLSLRQQAGSQTVRFLKK